MTDSRPPNSKLLGVFSLESLPQTASAILGTPRLLTAFSVSDDGAHHFGENRNRHLSYFHRPVRALYSGEISLREGFDEWRHTLQETRPTDSYIALLHSIMLHEKTTGERVKSDIVCTSLMMKQFLQSEKEERKTFKFDLVYFDGLMFLKEAHRSKPYGLAAAPVDFRVLRSAFYGHKFESCVTLGQPARAFSNYGDICRSLKNNYVAHGCEGYVAVVERNVKGITVVVSGEIDCVQDFPVGPEPALTPSRFIELKTTSDSRINFEAKLFRAWLQCVVMGTPTIVYGFQSPTQKLKEMERFEVAALPFRNLEGENCGTAVGQCVTLLEWIMTTVPRDSTKAWRVDNTNDRRFEFWEHTEGVEAIRSSVVTPEFQAWRTTGKLSPWTYRWCERAPETEGLTTAADDGVLC